MQLFLGQLTIIFEYVLQNIDVVNVVFQCVCLWLIRINSSSMYRCHNAQLTHSAKVAPIKWTPGDILNVPSTQCTGGSSVYFILFPLFFNFFQYFLNEFHCFG